MSIAVAFLHPITRNLIRLYVDLAWNSSTVLWIFWSGTGCLIHFINAIIWNDNAVNQAPVWCDISEHSTSLLYMLTIVSHTSLATRFIHVVPIGIITASALLNHRLYKLLKMSASYTVGVNVSFYHVIYTSQYKSGTSNQQKREMAMFDVGIGLGVPVISAGICEFEFSI